MQSGATPSTLIQPTTSAVPLQEETMIAGGSSNSNCELDEIEACYIRLKQLVPTVPLNTPLSSVQLLQHVIDYIVDLEVTLDSSSSSSVMLRQCDVGEMSPARKCILPVSCSLMSSGCSVDASGAVSCPSDMSVSYVALSKSNSRS